MKKNHIAHSPLLAPLALLAAFTLLSGCDVASIKTTLNNTAPKSAAQVNQWAQNVRAQASASASAPEQLIATRTLTELPVSPLNNKVFIANPDSKSTAEAKIVDTQNTEPLTNDSTNVYGSGEFSNGYLITPSYAAAKPTLAQAELTDLHFTGFLRQHNAEWAVLNVGDRLYRIKPGDTVGKGKWSVLSISESSITLTVDKKQQRITRESNPQDTLQKGMTP